MQQRVVVPERMDDPSLSEREHVQALRGLRRLNRWSGNAKAAWRPIHEVARFKARASNASDSCEADAPSLSVLDIATGAADVPIAICRYAAKHNIELSIDACDVRSTALDFARQSLPAKTPINLYSLDITAEPIDKQYDIVMCTTFLHHLSNEEATEVLAKMRQASRKRVIVVDLERGAMNWLQVWIACHALTRSAVVHFDGPQSVRAAFSIAEMEQMALEAGFTKYRLRRRWPCRFVFVGDP